MNYAVAILKTLACLAVVSVHSGGGIPLSGYAICTFMICSFVFWRVGSEADLVKRLKRLYLPFAVWSMVPWFLRGINGFDFDFGSLVLQLIFGLTESPALYFIVLLADYSVIVYCVQKAGRFWPVILTGLAVLCFVISQIGVNKGLWDSLPLCGRITCGRGVELFPCCAVGMLIGMGYGSKMRLIMGGGGAILFCLCLWTGWDTEGFGYASPRSLFGAIVACAVAVSLKDWLPPMWMRRPVEEIAKLTGGIYFVHYPLLAVLGWFKAFDLKSYGFLFTFAVFALSAAICFAGQRIRRLKGVFR